MTIEFFQTPMGRKFYERDVPKIANTLEDIAKELKRANDLKERELRDKIKDDLDKIDSSL
jgi:hypothetical protein